jgi:hypothetical protein
MEDLEHKKALIETIACALIFSQGLFIIPSHTDTEYKYDKELLAA